jgi:acyl carrier protein
MHSNVIDIGTFLRNVEREFDSPIPGGLQPEMCFRDLADWTSLQALIVVAGFERDYGVTISAEDLSRAETLQDLYGVVLERIGH